MPKSPAAVPLIQRPYCSLQVPTCRDNPILGAKVNVIGTLNVFEAAKAIKKASGHSPKIVYASSAAVFGPDAGECWLQRCAML